MSSTSSDQHRGGSSLGNDKMISDLKNVIQKRDTPRYLLMLSRILFMAITVLIILQIVEYQAQKSFLASAESMSDEFTLIESRLLKYTTLTMNIRSFANVGNNLEFTTYYDPSLQRINRFKLLSNLIQRGQSELQEIENKLQGYLLKDKGQSDSNALSENGFSGKLTQKSSKLQSEIIYLSQISTKEQISNFSIPYKFGLSTYLNNILNLNVTDEGTLSLPPYLIIANPFITDYPIPSLSTNSSYRQRQQDLWFILVNGLRGILDKTLESRVVFHNEIHDFSSSQSVTVIMSLMVAQIIIGSFIVGFLFHQVVQTERSKQDIMSIFSLLSTQDVKDVYDICDRYIERSDNGAEYKELLNPSKLIYNESELSQQFGETKESSNRLPIARTNAKTPQGKLKYSMSKKNEEEKSELSHSENELNPSNQVFIGSADQTREPSTRWYGLGTAYRPYYGRMIKRLGQLIKGDGKKKNKGSDEEEDRDLHYLERQAYKEAQRIADDKSMQAPQSRYQKESTGEIDVKPNKSSRVQKKLENVMGVKSHKQDLKTQRNQDAQMELQDVFSKQSKKHHNRSSNDPDLQGESDESHSQSFSVDYATGKRIKKGRKGTSSQRDKQQEQAQSIQQQMMQEQERKNRGRMLQDSSQQGRKAFWKSILLNSLVAAAFYTVFLYNYLFHLYKLNQFHQMELSLPTFYRRYSDIFLSFALMRERLVNLNLKSSELGFNLPRGDEYYREAESTQFKDMIEEYYHLSSMKDESEIQRLRVTYPVGLEPILDFESVIDSDQYCKVIFTANSQDTVPEVDSLINTSVYAGLSIAKLKSVAYQGEIESVGQAIRAAMGNDVKALRGLREKGVDLGKGDYDKRTPLHMASSNNSYEAVVYLLSINVKVNPIDRWGATPLNQGQFYHLINDSLIQKGAILGTQQQYYKLQKDFPSDDQQRLFYASASGDVALMDATANLGWDVNGRDIEGRTAFSIAASEGHLNAVKYLLSKGADINLQDARGYDPLDEALRRAKVSVYEYLINSVLVKQSCSNFESGLFNKGISQTYGYFHKKFSDLQILANQANGNRTFLYQLLGNQQFQMNDLSTSVPTSTLRAFQVFLSTQELYLNKVIDLMITSAEKSLTLFFDSYFIIVTIVFYLFISTQVITLLFLRSKLIGSLKNDVMQSRGILNLVPNSFFRKNQEAVEKVYKSMRI